ncbi:MotE family protein [Metabacillus indicus]|uniref:MotE family protein n=1 Tax=Metabacillus indicus TaxID=246786 RepID=UPI000492FF26|nr:hypothetical protein [Metabacillus indicus]KEZ50093.1 hypothetical protein AZ46_0205140 [Metabacillus indicus LMG 22858]
MKNDEKETGKFQWLLFVVIIPFFFTVTFIAVILTVAGIDVTGKLKETAALLPGISAEQKASGHAKSSAEKELKDENELQKSEIKRQQQDIAALENDRDLKEKEIQRLSQELRSMEEQLKAAAAEGENGRDVAKLYDKMTSKKAAAIIPLLSDEEALKILKAIGDDQVISVLEKMSPEDAAKYTNMLSDS